MAELLYSGDESLIVINMSEFQEAHTVSTLKGAPAGYVGYGQGGVLTEAVRRRPYSVVLLDEVEKAHPDVHEMFFQVFDKGYMDDAEGRHIDFKNTLILLTSNVGTDLITTMSEDEEMKPDSESLAQSLRPDLLKVFPPALLGRLVVQPYYPLSPKMLAGIVRLQLDRIKKRIAENHNIAFAYEGFGRGPDRVALQRSGLGWARDRCDFDQHDAAGTLDRTPQPPDVRRGGEEDQCGR